ncbi:hypothetical protein [Paraglaciecola sp.]|uniref:hypothetical protein n=1 Tax=Paraglaciecola sp. TaxID=1920173 RepID=UPI003EF74998
MKFILLICSVLLSSQAFAHQDHALGESHIAYHIAFYALLALVVFKGVSWLKAKKINQKKD